LRQIAIVVLHETSCPTIYVPSPGFENPEAQSTIPTGLRPCIPKIDKAAGTFLRGLHLPYLSNKL
jgi:hypothetical protein